MQTPITREAVQALLNLSTHGQLIAASGDKPLAYAHHQGAAKMLRNLLDGGGQRAAVFHASKGGYLPAAIFETAWARLPDGFEHLSLTDVQKFLRASGVEITTDVVTDGGLVAIPKLEEGVVAPVDAHDEHAASGLEIDDGSGLHGTPLGEPSMVAQGGEA